MAVIVSGRWIENELKTEIFPAKMGLPHFDGTITTAGLIFVLALTLIAISSVQADNDPETPWPIAECCLLAPTQPPEGWTFEGTIIATGWAGIHGMNVAFNDGWIVDGGFGTLSPDGIPQATFRPDGIYGGYGSV